LVKLNMFGRGLPLMMRAARSAPVRMHYQRHLKNRDSRRTVLALERLEGFEALVQEIEAWLPVVNVPVLILWGHPDAYFRRREVERLQEIFPRANVREIPGGGHFPIEDAPQVVTEELLRFLSHKDLNSTRE
jgi:pimeloyl-ACP methyl ester carboxylesterase